MPSPSWKFNLRVRKFLLRLRRNNFQVRKFHIRLRKNNLRVRKFLFRLWKKNFQVRKNNFQLWKSNFLDMKNNFQVGLWDNPHKKQNISAKNDKIRHYFAHILTFFSRFFVCRNNSEKYNTRASKQKECLK